MRRLACSLTTALLVSAGCALWQSPRTLARDQLRRELGWDPEVQLAAIGSPSTRSGEAAIAKQLCRQLNGQQQLRLLRFGLGHDDERVVFGAIVIKGHDSLSVPELRNAAKIVVPRLGDADCPVTIDAAMPLIGSGDFEALLDVIPRLPEEQAVSLLGNLHRMVRPDAIAPMCALAITSEGEVRRAALRNAGMTVAYGGVNSELFIATCLRVQDCEVESEASTAGMPGMLRTALAVFSEPGSEDMPLLSCARWLVASRPATADLPMLRKLLHLQSPMCEAAAWALGSMDDEGSHELLGGPAPENVSPTCWLAARARRGDEQALEQLLAGEVQELAYGLAVATPN